MWVITYKGRPATLDTLNTADAPTGASGVSRIGNQAYIAAPSKSACIKLYLREFGFSWPERNKGVECERFTIAD